MVDICRNNVKNCLIFLLMMQRCTVILKTLQTKTDSKQELISLYNGLSQVKLNIGKCKAPFITKDI